MELDDSEHLHVYVYIFVVKVDYVYSYIYVILLRTCNRQICISLIKFQVYLVPLNWIDMTKW